MDARPDGDPYIVSDETCLGCKYYDRNKSEALRMCDYTYITEKQKPKPIKPCSQCEVREDGEHASAKQYKKMLNGIIKSNVEERDGRKLRRSREGVSIKDDQKL